SKKVQAIYLWWQKTIIDQDLLQSLPNLKVIANSGVGMDHLDLKLVASFGVKMANARCAVSSSTADTGIASLLASARRLVEGCHVAVSSGMEYCEADFLGVEVTGATLGIIGTGSIWCKIALRAKAFEMDILYHNRRRRKEQEEQAVGTTYCEKVDNLLQQADFVMVVVSLTPQTCKLIGKREMELMKPTATLINISRGAVVDQEALVTALQTGVIRAAALDVPFPKPLPRDHTLLKLKNVIITPRLGIKTDKDTYMVTEEAAENILAALNGLPIPNEVLPS
ncbi:GRHPR reductase, partial [Aramus guarauna]|nr:GRHPR reductase [Aramus guarauna]